MTTESSTNQPHTSKITAEGLGKVAADREAALLAYDGPDRIITAREYRQLLKEKPKNKVKFMTGLRGLDALTEGCVGGELVIIGGPPKNGKTLLAQTLTRNFAQQGIGALWFSFEVPADQFFSQMPEDTDFCLPQMLIPYKTDWLHTRIEESKLKHGTRAVFIDHLHFLVDLARASRNFSVDIGEIIRGLKREAIRLNVVIFLLCHSTKAQGIDGQVRELQAMDMRDSSFITQEADTTWIVQRKAKTKEKVGAKWVKLERPIYTNKAVLKVCNHRRTGVMEQRIELEKGETLFHEYGEESRQFRELEAGSVPLDEEKPWTEKEETLPF